MGNLWDFMKDFSNEFIAKDKKEKKREKLEYARRINLDKLDEIKKEIIDIENFILMKKDELENTRGKRKKVIIGEIERNLKKLDNLMENETIISKNLERIDRYLIDLDKGELVHQGDGLREKDINEMIAEKEVDISVLEDKEQAKKDIENIKYQPETERMTEEELEGHMKEENKEEELSPEIKKKIEELEN